MNTFLDVAQIVTWIWMVAFVVVATIQQVRHRYDRMFAYDLRALAAALLGVLIALLAGRQMTVWVVSAGLALGGTAISWLLWKLRPASGNPRAGP